MRVQSQIVSRFVVGLVAVICVTAPLGARIRVLAGAQPGGNVNLPYMSNDSQGNQWMVYNGGMLQMQGNMPIFSQGDRITVNGAQPNVNNNMGRMDDKTGELILENMQAGNFTITRRMQFNQDDGYVRVIDVIKNTAGQDQQANLQWMSNINFGIQNAQLIPDPKKKDRNLAWVAQTGGPARVGIVVFCGKGAKVAPDVNWPAGNDFVQGTLNTVIPAGKEVAVVSILSTSATIDQATQWVNDLKDAKILADVPKDIRKLIINFHVSQSVLGDVEILRGDVLDVVELRSGDRLNGTLQDASYKLDTFYGPIDLPVAKVIGVLNVGQFHPRQLVVTDDGQMFGGYLQKQTIDLQLSSGQKTQIPLSQISRVGSRRRAGETDDNSTTDVPTPGPIVLMTSGDRIGVTLPATPIEVVTRYGTLHIPPDALSGISFLPEDSAVHSITLNDGSKFSGLVTASQFDFTLSSAGKEQNVKFPVGAMRQLMIKPHSDEHDDSIPALQMKKDDLLVGTLQGQLKLETPWDTITVNAQEIRAMAHPREGAPDVTLTMWDGSTSSGQLQDQDLSCKLLAGVDVRVPVALVQSYSNPQAQAPSIMMDKIKTIVADLNADDFKQREAASQQLVKMGPNVVGVLKQMRDSQPPEAQQRIDGVLKQLAKPVGKSHAAATPAPGVSDPAIVGND